MKLVIIVYISMCAFAAGDCHEVAMVNQVESLAQCQVAGASLVAEGRQFKRFECAEIKDTAAMKGE